MMILSTSPAPGENKNTTDVFWTTGYKTNGVISVQLGNEEADPLLIAELVAIRHLLFVKQVFGRKPISGKGYELRVFSGAIKKIAQGRSTKSSIVPYGLFLSGAMSGIQIKVEKEKTDNPLFGTVDTRSIDFIDATVTQIMVPQEQWDTALGTIYITRHAIEQYESRLNQRNRDAVSNPELSFHRAIGPDRIGHFMRVNLPEDVLGRKFSKYGDSEVETWCNPHTSLHLTVVTKNESPGVLVTCFYRENQDYSQFARKCNS